MPSNAFIFASHLYSRDPCDFDGSLKAGDAIQSFVTRIGASNASLAREIIIDTGHLFYTDFLQLQQRIHELEHWVKHGYITQLRLVVKTILWHAYKSPELPFVLDLLHVSESVNTLAAEVDKRIEALELGAPSRLNRGTMEKLTRTNRDLKTVLEMYCKPASGPST